MIMANNNENKILNVPNLRFPEFSGEWSSQPLTDFMNFKNGLNPDAKRFGRGTKFISVMDILNNQYICYDNIRASVELQDGDIETYGVDYGDILFQRSSETLEDVGRANVYLDSKPAIFGGFVIRGKSKGNYNPLFFRYLLASPTARKRIIVKGAGAQHFNIGQDGLSKVSLDIPRLSEQEKIGKLLQCVDARIATQNKIIEDLKKLKSAIIHRCYSSQTNMIPLSELLKQCSDRNRSGSDLQVLSVSNKYGFIAQSNQFEDREVASDDTSNYKVVKKGMFAYNPARINVGSIALYEMDGNGIVSPMYVCFTTKSELLPSYLKYYFASQTFKHEMYKRLEGSVRLCLTFEELCNIEIHLPSIEQQKNISKYISKIENNLSLVDSIFSKYQQQRRYLLSQMFI
ncbi:MULTISPECIES: restriction endonuclease subunit S [Bacteroides]|uniref:restriction endonuclease subunit S n=2 Tax=Bacteroidales TaxID=171549 RepID=UPI0022AA81E2|nr:restriction endonuclease subunit S [Bacteroides stercoris]MCS3286988.1 restriction endonuclease subunit S [Bacteroides fragilis]MCZ2502342.1 restriction endonuclease subunit S [Bacteroides fragilis]MDC2297420.1 restriction endonuclease subunit S [Bacteroides stercoris]